jgi:hypothetical protein
MARLTVSPLAHGWGVFHLIVSAGSAQQATVLDVIAITKCWNWATPVNCFTVRRDVLRQVWPHTSDDAGWMEKIMSKTNEEQQRTTSMPAAATAQRELTTADLDGVSGGMPQIEIAPEPTGHGLPLGKCEAYNRVYDQFFGSS